MAFDNQRKEVELELLHRTGDIGESSDKKPRLNSASLLGCRPGRNTALKYFHMLLARTTVTCH